jgi:hypothetical protein
MTPSKGLLFVNYNLTFPSYRQAQHNYSTSFCCSSSAFSAHLAFISRSCSADGLEALAEDKGVCGDVLTDPDGGSGDANLAVLGKGVDLPVTEAQGALVAGSPGVLDCPVHDEVGPGRTADLVGPGAKPHGALVPAS